MRVATIRNLSSSAVGICGKTVMPGTSIGVPLSAIQRTPTYSAELELLIKKGFIAVYIEGDKLTADQAENLDAPLSVDLENPDVLRSTVASLQLYADGTLGDDNNDGLTSATPKRTRAAVFALVPYYVKHNVCVNLSGIFTDAATTLERFVAAGVSLVIDGGPGTTVVNDNGGLNFTSDIASASSIGLTTAGWVSDAYRGQWVEILDGPAAGQTRTIQGNDTTTLTPIRNYSTSPVAGAKFRIVRPTTAITGGDLVVKNTGAGFIWMQRLYVSGATCALAALYSPGPVNLTHLVSAGSKFAAVSLQFCPNAQMVGYMISPTLFTSPGLATETHCGVSQIGASTYGIYLLSDGLVLAYGVVANSILAYKTMAVQINRGGRVLFEYLNCCATNGLSTANIGNTTGYATTKLGGHPVFGATTGAIWMNYSSLCIGTGVDISGSLHGVDMNHSQLRLESVAGTNTASGCYARMMSSIQVKSGTTPTLTGSGIGNLTVDGATEASTWAAIAGGTPFVDAAVELVIAKVFTPPA